MKKRANSSENRKFVVVAVKSALGIVKKMLTNGGFVKLLWENVGLARAGKKGKSKYFRQRYSDQQLKCLNKLIKTRGRIRTLLSKTAFLKANISQQTLPKSVRFCVEKSLATVSPNIERAFMHDKIEKNQSMAAFLRTKCCSLWQEARQFLSFFDLVRFCRYLSVIDEQKEAVNQKKNSNNLRLFFNIVLAIRQVSSRTTLQTCLTTNYQTLNSVLSHELSFCLPSTSVKREEVLADFEVLHAQLVHH